MAIGVSLSAVTAADGTFSSAGAAAWLTVKDRTATLTGFGTGVETALGVNVGSAGAVIVNGGALGTPSSGVATNLTGTASGLTAGNATLAAGLSATLVVASGGTNLTSGTANGVVYFSSTSQMASGTAFTFDGTNPSTTGAYLSTKSSAGAFLTNVGGNNCGFGRNGSTGHMQLFGGGAAASDSNAMMGIDGFGNVTLPSGGSFMFSSTSNPGNPTRVAGIYGTGTNQFSFAAGGGSSGTNRTVINKATTGIADNTATATLTVTVPNAAHSASIRVRLTGSMGAGGAIGANESTQDAEYMINIARTLNLNAVATIGAVVGQAAAAAVAGAGTVAVTGELSAIAGANNATNTFTINVKIVKSGGSSANHTCLAFAEVLNANSAGVTIA